MHDLTPQKELLTGVVAGDFSLLGESPGQKERKRSQCEYFPLYFSLILSVECGSYVSFKPIFFFFFGKPRALGDQNKADPSSGWYPSPKAVRSSVIRLMPSISTQY